MKYISRIIASGIFCLLMLVGQHVVAQNISGTYTYTYKYSNEANPCEKAEAEVKLLKDIGGEISLLSCDLSSKSWVVFGEQTVASKIDVKNLDVCKGSLVNVLYDKSKIEDLKHNSYCAGSDKIENMVNNLIKLDASGNSYIPSYMIRNFCRYYDEKSNVGDNEKAEEAAQCYRKSIILDYSASQLGNDIIVKRYSDILTLYSIKTGLHLGGITEADLSELAYKLERIMRERNVKFMINYASYKNLDKAQACHLSQDDKAYINKNISERYSGGTHDYKPNENLDTSFYKYRQRNAKDSQTVTLNIEITPNTTVKGSFRCDVRIKEQSRFWIQGVSNLISCDTSNSNSRTCRHYAGDAPAYILPDYGVLVKKLKTYIETKTAERISQE